MLARLFEWYRAVHVQPDESTLTKRRAAVTALVKTIEKPKQVPMLIAFGSVAVRGFAGVEGMGASGVLASVHTSIVEAIRKESAIFPADLADNALETRVAAALAIGEVITKSAAKVGIGAVAASLVRTALPLQPLVEERYVQAMLAELSDHAARELEEAARKVRSRRPIPEELWNNLAQPAGTDIATFWPNAVQLLQEAFETLQEQARLDREELQVLSWLYAGVSETTGERLTALPAAAAALAAGGEIANAALLPPVESLRSMVSRAVHTARQANQLEPVNLATVAEQWNTVPKARELLRLLAVKTTSVRELVTTHPVLLPVSWLCYRLADGVDVSSSLTELERQAGIDLQRTHSIDNWALQVFNERTAQRLYAQYLEG